MTEPLSMVDDSTDESDPGDMYIFGRRVARLKLAILEEPGTAKNLKQWTEELNALHRDVLNFIAHTGPGAVEDEQAFFTLGGASVMIERLRAAKDIDGKNAALREAFDSIRLAIDEINGKK